LQYSTLRSLYDGLLVRHPLEAKALQPFPGKTWTTPSEQDWKTRCVVLNGYFAGVMNSQTLRNDAEVKQCFARTAEAEPWTPPSSDLTEEQEDRRYRFVDLEGGVRIGYIEEGDQSKPLVLFVHGFPDTLWTWVGIIVLFYLRRLI
jgi:hypothetical protein